MNLIKNVAEKEEINTVTKNSKNIIMLTRLIVKLIKYKYE